MRRDIILTLLSSSLLLLSGCAPHLEFGEDETFAQQRQEISAAKAESNRNQLEKASASIRAGDNGKARAILDAINIQHLDAAQQAQYDLLYAQLHLSAGAPEQALQILDGIAPQTLGPQEQRSYHQSRAFAYALTDRHVEAAKEYIALAELLTKAEERRDNQNAILDALSQVPEASLQNAGSNTLGGWMALALLLKQYPQGSSDFEAALQQWQANYPQHPADLKLLGNYTASAPAAADSVRNIALLLPETGPLAQAAAAIKAGFLAAEAQDRSGKPKIRFYDSTAGLAGLLYQQAVADGANLVVGPLEKEQLKLLAETTQLTVPVLALNYVPGISASNLYQFTLSPVDEAEQAAARAWADGRRKALILVPDTDLGKRIAQGYADAWRGYQGTVLKTQYYDPKNADFAQSLEQLLNVDESAGRYQDLSQVVPDLQFTPRQHGDSDALFITADPAAARALNRQLQTYHLDNLAVYATPHLYSDSPDPAQDEALDGITFCDIPWFFPGAYQDNIDAAALRKPWKQMQSIYSRLLAMGIDAYHLASGLTQLDHQEYPGATGNLLRLPDGRMRRNLYCVRFSNGIPEPLGFTESSGDVADTPAAPAP